MYKQIFFIYSKTLVCILVFIYPLLIFVGYSNLANYILMNLLQTVLCIALFLSADFSLRWLIRIGLKKVLNKNDKEFSESLLAYWIVTLFDIFVFIFMFMALSLIWGVLPQSITDMLQIIFVDGIQIGGSTFAVLTLLEAVILFFIVYYITKLIVFIMHKKVFPYTRIDQGSKEAITIGLQYAGLIIGIVMAVSSLGFSASSIAFIISAFTFGLSFALRDIFSNFLSGIILLIERPVKIGDWVDVGNESGVVKKIRLRATIVETFNRKTLLIPNSQFITQTVSNDMYNPIARLIVEIECSYDDDPEEVKGVLLSIARNHAEIIKDPEPSVLFDNFNSSGLLFKLRVFCLTANRTSLSSALRYIIFDEFKKNGIEIPYPKQDIYIKEYKS